MTENSIINDIYQQFIDYFGEENTDLQPYSPYRYKVSHDSYCHAGDYVITVHWQDVTIINEYDESVNIWDLYALTIVNSDGRLVTQPEFNRSTYDSTQWNSGYLHSHVQRIIKSNIRIFQDSCLGSGPIRSTIQKLKTTSYTDMDVWGLYCWELDKYVHVESLTGVPYIKLGNIGISSGNSNEITDFTLNCELRSAMSDAARHKDLISSITKHILSENILKFAYVYGHYTLGIPFTEAVFLISNSFIDWYNTDDKLRSQYTKEFLYGHAVMANMYFNGRMFYDRNNRNIPIEAVIGTEIFKFKGTPIKLSIKDFNNKYTAGEVHILNPSLLSFIIYTILKYINVKYGRSKEDTLTENARII